MTWTKAPEPQRRAQILAAAFSVAASKGLARVTVRAVAEEAGLSHGLVLFHFTSKDVLLEALLGEVLDWLLTVSTPATGTAPTFASLLRGELAAAETDRAHMAVLLDFWVIGTRTPRLRQRLGTAIARYEELLASASPGDPAGPDAGVGTPQQLAALGTAVVFGAALRTLLGDGPPSRTDIADDPVTTLERLLPPRP